MEQDIFPEDVFGVDGEVRALRAYHLANFQREYLCVCIYTYI